MMFKIEKIERFTGDLFSWYEANLTTTDGAKLTAFYDITEDEFRLFYAESLSWPQRDSIRDQIMTAFRSMLATESEIKS